MRGRVWPITSPFSEEELIMPHALLVEDDPTSRSALAELVEREGYSSSPAGGAREAHRLAAERQPDLLLVDLQLPDGDGLDLARELIETHGAEGVLITGHASVGTAVEALRIGLVDYLTKPIDLSRLRSVLTSVARTRAFKGEIADLRGELRRLGRFGLLVGLSDPMQEVFDLIARVAPTEAPVLIAGESGTGKELVARTLHQLSRRARGPFVALNCGAVSASLVENELFGHEKGSFTGADQRHRGVFERACGGTLLLDEITEMPVELQARLLRVLETGSFTRLGGESAVESDVRIVSATNRDPDEAVAEGRLRHDLLFRLNVFPIQMPPLRRRGGDVERLATEFLDELNAEQKTEKRWTPEALRRLGEHTWPGNVRELRNVVLRAYILAEEDVGPGCLPPLAARGLEEAGGGSSVKLPVGATIAEAERRMILATLDELEGDKRGTASTLGISLKTLYTKLKAYRQGA
jgi:DNA-binding NtrC family response regulator